MILPFSLVTGLILLWAMGQNMQVTEKHFAPQSANLFVSITICSNLNVDDEGQQE